MPTVGTRRANLMDGHGILPSLRFGGKRVWSRERAI